MINLGAFSVNVLPILMTVINLASALVYTHNMTRRDKMQLYGMAAVFLVLLYDAASGLVLYWTCNNIFSLGKNIVYSLLERVQKPAAAIFGAVRGRFAHQSTEVFPGGGLYGVPLMFWGVAVILALLSSNQAFFVPESIKNAVSLSSDFAYIASIVVAVVLAVKLRLWKHHWVILLLTVVAAYYGLRVWGKWYFFGANRKSFALSSGFLFLIPALGVLHAGIDLRRFLYSEAHSARSTKPAETLLAPAGIWITLLLAAYLPVQAYCTAVEIFSTPDVVLAKSLLWCAGIGVVVWLFAFLAGIVGSRNFAGYFLGAVTLLFTVYAFLLPLDTGTIDAFQISNPAALFRSANLLTDFAVVFGAYIWLIRSGHTLWIKSVFVLCIVGSLVNGSYLLWQSRGQWQTDTAPRETAADELPDYNDRLFGFSKTGENIVVVMMDAFTGTHMERILQAEPEHTLVHIARQLRGKGGGSPAERADREIRAGPVLSAVRRFIVEQNLHTVERLEWFGNIAAAQSDRRMETFPGERLQVDGGECAVLCANLLRLFRNADLQELFPVSLHHLAVAGESPLELIGFPFLRGCPVEECRACAEQRGQQGSAAVCSHVHHHFLLIDCFGNPVGGGAPFTLSWSALHIRYRSR